jgi:glycosyltransferase involved in cell wall biosynthesis
VERTPTELRDEDIDVVVLQRGEDEEHVATWTGRRAGRDVPAVWLEHNAPQGRIASMRHEAADRDDLMVVHVTHTNALFWDCGSTRTRVIEHGVVDPGHRYTGELRRVVVAINEPRRRGRVTGTDLLESLSRVAPIDLYGMGAADYAAHGGAADVTPHDDVPPHRMHDEMARRRVYLHPMRWTSLGLSLIEAMQLGLPVVALATTEAPDAVPPEAGVVTNRPDALQRAIQRFIEDPAEAFACGTAARAVALERYGLRRFLHDWDALLEEVVA